MLATRRHLLMASIGLGVPAVRPAHAARRVISFAAFGGLFQTLFEPAIVAPFAASRANIGVSWQVVASSTQAVAALRRQRDRPAFDVVLLEAGAARVATEEGLLEPLSLASMPVLGDLGPGFVSKDIAGPVVYTEPLVMLHDAARDRPPPFWKLLWARSGERELAIPEPPDAAGIAFAVVAGRLFGGGGLPRSLELGIEAIARLAPRVVTWNPRPDVYTFVGDGGARLGVGWNLPAQALADRQPGKLGVAIPVEGTVSRSITVNLVKGAREPDAARQFIAWLLGPEAQRDMVERMYLGPVNRKALYSEAALARTANTPAHAASAMPIDWFEVNARRADITQRWRETVPSAG